MLISLLWYQLPHFEQIEFLSNINMIFGELHGYVGIFT